MSEQDKIDENNNFLKNLYLYLNIAVKILLKSYNTIVVVLVAVFLFILAVLSLIFNRK